MKEVAKWQENIIRQTKNKQIWKRIQKTYGKNVFMATEILKIRG